MIHESRRMKGLLQMSDEQEQNDAEYQVRLRSRSLGKDRGQPASRNLDGGYAIRASVDSDDRTTLKHEFPGG